MVSICNKCKKSVGRCSWSRSLIPVKDWNAEYVKGGRGKLPSYCVKTCPEFEHEPERKATTNNPGNYYDDLIRRAKDD